MNFLLLLHFFSCSFMTGVIWLVQILVYPNFRLIADSPFPKFHEFHSNRITWVVAPVMLLELVTGAWLASIETHPFYLWNLVSVIALWTLTGFVSVPQHNLLHKKPTTSRDWLIWTNWPRTLLWTARALGLIWMINHSPPGAIL